MWKNRLVCIWREPTLTRLMRDKCGATAIEYGLIAAGIAVAIIAAINSLGSSFSNLFK